MRLYHKEELKKSILELTECYGIKIKVKSIYQTYMIGGTKEVVLIIALTNKDDKPIMEYPLFYLKENDEVTLRFKNKIYESDIHWDEYNY